jgi:hypothetical protein
MGLLMAAMPEADRQNVQSSATATTSTAELVLVRPPPPGACSTCSWPTQLREPRFPGCSQTATSVRR